MYDEQKNAFIPTLVGLGMLVEVKDPDDKQLLSRVISKILNLMKILWFIIPGLYKIQEWDVLADKFHDQSSFSLGMHVTVTDPTGKIQLSRVMQNDD